MSCGSPFNHLLKNVKGSFLNHELFSTSKPKYDDDVIECMQFGICSSNPPRLKDIPYFHFKRVILNFRELLKIGVAINQMDGIY